MNTISPAAEARLTRALTYEEERGKPAPSSLHGAVQVNLAGELAKHREFRVLSEVDLNLNGRDLTPDLSLYHRRPIDFRHDVLRRTDPPLVAVEISTPNQVDWEVMDRVKTLLAAGVLSVWVVTLPVHNVTIYTPDGQEHPFTSGVITDPAIGVTADLAAVFS